MNARRAELQLLLVQAVLQSEVAKGRADPLVARLATDIIAKTALEIEADGSVTMRDLLADVRAQLAAVDFGS